MADARAGAPGDGAAPEGSALQDRVLDAAERCFARWGAAKTSIDDVAAEAGLSRATVYRHMGNRGELITAVGIRTWEREQRDWHVGFAGGMAGRDRVVEALLWS